MTSTEPTEDQIGKTKVTAAFFKKLGEKLRNYQRYQKPVQLSGSSSVHSSPLDLSNNIRLSVESMSSAELRSAEKAKQIFGEKLKYNEKKQQIGDDKRKDRNGKKEKLEDNMKNQNMQENKELIRKKKKKKIMNFENDSREREDISESLTESYQSRHSSSTTDINKQSQNEEASMTATTSSSKSLISEAKLADVFHDGVKINFNLGNNNILSILKSKNDPNAIIYDLQNPNGCKIHLEKLANRAMLLSVDSTGKRLYISCNF